MKKSTIGPQNPNGCWDWWGYNDGFTTQDKYKYATKDGDQIRSVWNMISKMTIAEEQQ